MVHWLASLVGEIMVGSSEQLRPFLAHAEITLISSEVIRRYPHQGLAFVGVMSFEGGSGRAEVMVTIRGCHYNTCDLILNLSRQDRATLEEEFRQKLNDALLEHTTLS